MVSVNMYLAVVATVDPNNNITKILEQAFLQSFPFTKP